MYKLAVALVSNVKSIFEAQLCVHFTLWRMFFFPSRNIGRKKTCCSKVWMVSMMFNLMFGGLRLFCSHADKWLWPERMRAGSVWLRSALTAGGEQTTLDTHTHLTHTSDQTGSPFLCKSSFPCSQHTQTHLGETLVCLRWRGVYISVGTSIYIFLAGADKPTDALPYLGSAHRWHTSRVAHTACALCVFV